jgi:sugar phosphate isomerase/epimerase
MSHGDDARVAQQPLVLWAGCVQPYDLIERVDALHSGNFSSMSIGVGDVLRLERERGWSVDRIATELRTREAPVLIVDGFISWYPGWTPADPASSWADWLNASQDTILRYADVFGAELISVLSPFDGGDPRPVEEVAEHLAPFVDRAAEQGLRAQLELIPSTRMPDFETVMSIIKTVDRDNLGLVFDTFHFTRSGCTPQAAADIPAERVFSVQICDGPLTPKGDDYFDEVIKYRTFAGDGEHPVKAFVQAVTTSGSIPPIGPEIFALDVHAMAPADAGALCAQRSREFLASAIGPAS